MAAPKPSSPKANLIRQRVELARRGDNPYVITRMSSGWLVIGDVQPLRGYCLLLADPVVDSLNDLNLEDRRQFCLDMVRAGDALLSVTVASRINYEILGNRENALHAHITPRYASEFALTRRMAPSIAHPKLISRRFDPKRDHALVQSLRETLA